MSTNFQSAIFIQDKCYQHAWIRTRDSSHIFERPERLRAVKLGLAAAIAHIETHLSTSVSPLSLSQQPPPSDADELSDALKSLNILEERIHPSIPVTVIQSMATVTLLNNDAVKFIHGDLDGDIYLENLIKWARESRENISTKGSEIPDGHNQGDMYLCPESIDAIQGAVGTTCEAIDAVFSQDSPIKRAFVAIRPPGHHCGEDTPAGFCFVNNVAVGVAHAHLRHNARRIVILDIDLHHGNGTQSIIWQVNEETYRQTLERESGSQAASSGPQVYFGSLHDILSYPCEDGKPELVQAASTCLHGPHGQHIENIHLQPYTSEEDFKKIYQDRYIQLVLRAEQFLESTGGPGDDVIVFMSSGMDACEHENEGMSRHGRKVPVSFYNQFTQDARSLADRFAGGRLVSVLEGGYSDRALISASMAHFTGLTMDTFEPDWWSVDNLTKIEIKGEALKKKKGPRSSLKNTAAQIPPEPWLDRTMALFTSILDAGSASITVPRGTAVPVPHSTRTLRDRKKAPPSTDSSTSTSAKSNSGTTKEPPGPEAKKLPKVILKLGPKPSEP